jgi:hypothetical protein
MAATLKPIYAANGVQKHDNVVQFARVTVVNSSDQKYVPETERKRKYGNSKWKISPPAQLYLILKK